ncbi:hypothetical protein WUBG_15174 [Wuchereria bancrofti]|uniref:Uncharacterized protein n=1 Tax=Wuchereria bancrofti TaxID=6293 RepID=J9DVZ5_WUCBA|nr:hypothetical protein WUBG_15174 [Wuchereria bancrofti]
MAQLVAELQLNGNPIHCDYKLLAFLPDVLRLRSIHNVICVTPDELHNISISSLDTVEITLEDAKQTLIILCPTLIVFTILIIPVNEICTDNDVFLKQTDFIYLSAK